MEIEKDTIIILAAGQGTRLQPFTITHPKALLPLCGRPLIDYTLLAAEACHFKRVILVVGHKAEMIEQHIGSQKWSMEIDFIHNTRYGATNSIYSLYLTAPKCIGPVCVIDGDVIVSIDLLRRARLAKEDSLVIDVHRDKVSIDVGASFLDGRVWHLGQEIPKEEVNGEFFGVSSWTQIGLRLLYRDIEALILDNKTHVWYEHAIRNLAKHHPIQCVEATSSEWAEVDRATDIAWAESVLRQEGLDRLLVRRSKGISD